MTVQRIRWMSWDGLTHSRLITYQSANDWGYQVLKQVLQTAKVILQLTTQEV